MGRSPLEMMLHCKIVVQLVRNEVDGYSLGFGPRLGGGCCAGEGAEYVFEEGGV